MARELAPGRAEGRAKLMGEMSTVDLVQEAEGESGQEATVPSSERAIEIQVEPWILIVREVILPIPLRLCPSVSHRRSHTHRNNGLELCP